MKTDGFQLGGFQGLLSFLARVRLEAEGFIPSTYTNFWDPGGFTADGISDNFARRRQTEAAGRLPTTASTAAVIAAAAGQAATSACQAAGMRTAGMRDKFTPRQFTTRQARHHGLIPDDNRGSS